MNRHMLPPGLFLVALIWASLGCTPIGEYGQVYNFGFTDDLEGWVGGFADYPADTTGWPSFDLNWGHEPLPSNLGTGGSFHISGNNPSDDLFMYIKGQIAGLAPFATYRVRFEIKVATNAPSGCAGIGGAVGESVHLKAGATTVEPDTVVEDDYYVMNIDKGNQAAGGEDAIVLGHIGNSNTDCLNPVYEIKSFDSKGETFKVTTGATGSLWLLVGTDSGFEGATSLYYTRVRIYLAQGS